MMSPVTGRSERARLADLRERCQRLKDDAAIGAIMRAAIADAGSPTWLPHEDLFWHAWILERGDETAKEWLAYFIELLRARAAELEAENETSQASQSALSLFISMAKTLGFWQNSMHCGWP